MTEVRSEETFDAIVIGAGPVGENVADRLVKGGLSTLLVEAELIGGECSYWACMPSKALIRPGVALNNARQLAGSREAINGQLDAQAVLERRNSFASNWKDDGQLEWVENAGISLRRGKAWLIAPRTVEIADPEAGTHLAHARQVVVLATGSVPTTPDIPGLAEISFWGTREATSSPRVPESLLVIGGGVAGTELAQAYARLGASVSQLMRGKLLAKMPEPARKLVAEGLAKDSVKLREGVSFRKVSRDSAGVHLELDDGEILQAEEILVATGRTPAVTELGLAALELSGFDGRRLRTDQSGKVDGTDWLYAVGDVAGKVLLTHQGKYEARITGDAIVARINGDFDGTAKDWGKYTQTADQYAVPSVVFTDPEIATVGRTVERAEQDGVKVTEVSLPIAVAGSSLYLDDYQGWAQLVIDADRNVIIGATFAGPDVAELLHSATIAIVGEVPLDRLWHAVPSYPTVSEIWLRLLEKLGL
ncbi:dihydrolipoyl dehydrogenase family protein [Psychromicrobium lacuslunae]|uniref:Pyridine nucleotide-disulfide oxidoreductase n=1 Tax=Psychromicrobium lacuslunae TaxID=1618207 RepID=A0A0D4C0C2_9MICC|nr:NAD(P)/FAD-dependent oxidoreductase [Psychromicrobium lacuslunae]AJT42122.1 pyridine nucleotide-disulfide oxidoreductase [Psychromicrobium lacuslunae]